MFQEQAPSCVLKFALRERVSGASSLVCTEICFAGACFKSKLPRVYWLGYLPGSMFRERVSGASVQVCTGWGTYPRACLGSVFQEQAPSCVPAFIFCDSYRPRMHSSSRPKSATKLCAKHFAKY